MSTLSPNTSSSTSVTALSPNSSSTSNSDFFQTPSRLSGQSFLSIESHEIDFDIDLSSVEIGYATQVDVGRQTPSFQQAWGAVKPRTNRRPSGGDDGLAGATRTLSLRGAKSVPSLRRLRSVRSPSPIPLSSPRRSVSPVEIPENERGSDSGRDSVASTLPALTAVPESSRASDLQDRLEARLRAIEASLAGLQAALSPLTRLSGIEEQIDKLVSTAASAAQTATLAPPATDPPGWTMPRLGLPHQTTGSYASPYPYPPYPSTDPNGLALPHLYSIPLGHPVGRSPSPGLSHSQSSTGYNHAPAPAAYHGRRSSSNSISIGFGSHSPYPGATTNVEPQLTALERERALFQRESAVRRREEAVDRRERAFAAYAAGYGSLNGSPNLGVSGAAGMSAPPSIPSRPGSARGMMSLSASASASRETVLEEVNEPDVSGRAVRSHTHTHAHSHSLSTSILHAQPPTPSPAPHPPLRNRYSGLLGITPLLVSGRAARTTRRRCVGPLAQVLKLNTDGSHARVTT